MSFPKYEAYKDSGVEWLGEVPRHWVRKRLKNVSPFITVGIVVNPSSYTAEEGLPYLYGGEIREGYIEVDKARKISALDSQRNRKTMLEANDIVTVRVGYPGVSAVVPPECKGGNCASIMLTKHGDFNSQWLCFLMNSHLIRRQVEIVQYGAAQKQFNIADAVEFWLFEPPKSEQTQIAHFLDHETAQIDALIAEQQQLIKLISEKRKALVTSSMSLDDSIEWTIGQATKLIARPVRQKEDEIYTPIGLFNRGRGIFHKTPRLKDSMGDSDFFWIKQGDLIISGQFAWEGAVAIASDKDEGCVVSHRFPVLRGSREIMRTEYLFAFLTTKHGDFLLNENSRGAAGRNKPLNMNSFLREKIVIPPMFIQDKIAQLVKKEKELRVEVSRQEELLQERRAALIVAVVTGKIDVRGWQAPASASPAPTLESVHVRQ